MIKSLSGYKTYITCAGGILTNVGMYLAGQETSSAAINACIVLLVGVFIRSGVASTQL